MVHNCFISCKLLYSSNLPVKDKYLGWLKQYETAAPTENIGSHLPGRDIGAIASGISRFANEQGYIPKFSMNSTMIILGPKVICESTTRTFINENWWTSNEYGKGIPDSWQSVVLTIVNESTSLDMLYI